MPAHLNARAILSVAYGEPKDTGAPTAHVAHGDLGCKRSILLEGRRPKAEEMVEVR
jgi:hypothetical protein